MRTHCVAGTLVGRFGAISGLAILLCLTVTGCKSSAPSGASSGAPAESTPATPAAQPGEQRYHLKGTIVQIDKPQHHLVIDHEDIPGFMAAMTMPYPVADDKTLDMVSVGDQITADVVVTPDNKIKLDHVVVVKKASGTKPASSSQVQPAPGVAVPDFALVNQDGKRIDLRQYAGKTVLMTFIYTRCPLPEYCPLATHNFAEIEKQLARTPELHAKTHLLTVSFDSKYDTPAVLRNYAKAFVSEKGAGPGTFAHWEFATVPENELREVTSFFNIFMNQQDGQIMHSMCTVVIAPDGRLYKQYDNNDWKPAEMLAALTAATPDANQAPLQASSAR